MATAQELFSLTNSTEEHIVVGADRYITVPEPLKRIAVQFDHDVETVTFDCPRYWDDLDMSTMTVYINYKLPNGDLDAYPAKNIKADGDIMHFDWTISNKVTQFKGNLTFLVCVKKTGTDGVEVNHWNSELCTDMYISEGMECEEQTQLEYSDLITQLLERMTVVEQINVQADEMREMHDEVLSETTGIRQTSANAIKGTASGEVLQINDVSPVEHNVNTKVYGKNLIGAFKSSKAVVRDGVTLSVEANGQTIMLNGTCGSSGGGRNLLSEASSIFTLEKGKTYTLSQELVSGTTDGTYSVYVSTVPDYAAVANTSNISGYTTKTFTPNKNMECIIGVNATANTTYENVVVRFQLEEGDTATDYEPYIDPTTVAVKGCNKNLVPFGKGNYYAGRKQTINGVTFVINEDGSVTANGTATAGASFQLKAPTNNMFSKGTHSVVLSGCPEGGASSTYCMRVKNDATGYGNMDEYGTSKTIKNFSFEGSGVYCIVFSGVTVNNITFYPQIEFGEIPTEYEPGNITTYTPAADGSVDVKSVSPFMQIFTDTPGVTLDCEYNKDTNTIQSDWNENDKNSPTYIKNRTHYTEEVEVDYVTLAYNGEIDPRVSKHNKKLGLVIGQTYTCDMYEGNALIKTVDVVAIECSANVNPCAVQLLNEDYFSIVDGIDANSTASGWIASDSVLYEFYDHDISKVLVRGLSGVETIVHKIPSEYYDSQETVYRFNIAKLSNMSILNSDLKALNFDLIDSYFNAKPVLNMDYTIYTALQNQTTGEITTLIDIPAQYDNYIEMLGNSFNNAYDYSEPYIYNEVALGNMPMKLSEMCDRLVRSNYCTGYDIHVGSYSSTIITGYKAIGLSVFLRISFASEAQRTAVRGEFIDPVFATNTHFGITYKKPAPVVDCGYVGP